MPLNCIWESDLQSLSYYAVLVGSWFIGSPDPCPTTQSQSPFQLSPSVSRLSACHQHEAREPTFCCRIVPLRLWALSPLTVPHSLLQIHRDVFFWSTYALCQSCDAVVKDLELLLCFFFVFKDLSFYFRGVISAPVWQIFSSTLMLERGYVCGESDRRSITNSVRKIRPPPSIG